MLIESAIIATSLFFGGIDLAADKSGPDRHEDRAIVSQPLFARSLLWDMKQSASTDSYEPSALVVAQDNTETDSEEVRQRKLSMTGRMDGWARQMTPNGGGLPWAKRSELMNLPVNELQGKMDAMRGEFQEYQRAKSK